MLKFRWSRRCWETLLGKNDTRALLEEAAAAVHHLGLVPMPPGSALRQVYDDLAAHGGAMAAVGLNNANNTSINNVINSSTSSTSTSNGASINVGNSNSGSTNPTPANPEAAQQARPHSAAHADGGLMHAASLGVPPVAAGVLRDMHRQGALNGEAGNMWGDASGGGGGGGGGTNGGSGASAAANPTNPVNPNPGMERVVGAPPPATAAPPAPTPAVAPVPAPAAPGGSAGFPPDSGSGGVSGASGAAAVSVGGAALPTGHWAPPPALPGSNSGVAPNTSGASVTNNVNVGMNQGSANSTNPAGKRKAGAAFSDTGPPAVDTDW